MDSIFTHFIARGDATEANKRLSFASWFISSVPATEFFGEERLFYSFLNYIVIIVTINKFSN